MCNHQDPTALPSRAADSSDSPNARLAALERRAQTLQLALEVLSEWLASGVPNSALLANAGEIDGADDEDGMMRDSGDEEEEWGGAAMDVEDADMMGDDDDDVAGEGDASLIKQEQDGVIRRRRGDTPEAVARRMQRGAGNDDDDDELVGDDDEMLDDLAATADSDGEGEEDENGSAEVAANGGSSVLLAASLPLQLLALSRPATGLSFLPLTAFAEASSSKGSSNGLIGTAAVEGGSSSVAAAYPAALSTLSEAVTTIHVRAIEALNNLYVTLSRGKSTRRDPKELQEVFETALGLVQGALEAASKASSASNDGAAEAASAATATASGGKKGKSGGGSGTRKQQEEEVDEVQERRREVVMAGMGVVWGCTILGLDPERNGKLVRCIFNSRL